MFPAIEPSEVGITGLIWLFLSYGYVLYFSAGMIGEGSELLLLVPSLAGLVGSVVLPLLGAVPDGALVLFSGMGAVEEAQESLSVGVGALAGSTVMLLTIPWSLSIYGGRVNLGENGLPDYMGKPKLTKKDRIYEELTQTGVTITEPVRQSGVIMVLTTIPYFLIQIPAFFIHGDSSEEIAAGEKWWALSGLVVCLAGLCWYMYSQIAMAKEGDNQSKRMAVMKKRLKEGSISLSGLIASEIKKVEGEVIGDTPEGYGTMGDPKYPPAAVASLLKEILQEGFYAYDVSGDGQLDRHECNTFFRDFNEVMTDKEMKEMFDNYDTDQSGLISFDEFIGLAYAIIRARDDSPKIDEAVDTDSNSETQEVAVAEAAFAEGNEEEEEEMPEEFTAMSPADQQKAIMKKAFGMLLIGTTLVVLFSDPMVDVIQEIAERAEINPFYVSFVLAPLASNASEFVASMYYASKKTRKTITVSLSALVGAASMNNTFCLSIFMALVYFRGLAWQYTAETLVIVIVQLIMGYWVRETHMTLLKATMVLSIFPLSLLLVATLEAIGLD